MVEQIELAQGTPYETRLSHPGAAGQQVLAPEIAAVARGALADVVAQGTARGLLDFLRRDGKGHVVGGKTGTGDHRFETYAPGRRLIESRVVNRAATFVFQIDDRFFGNLTAYVPGPEAARYQFTSALPVQAVRPLAPGSGAGSRRARRTPIRAHLLRWRPRPGRSTYREYASRPGFGRRLAAGPFSPPVAPPCSACMEWVPLPRAFGSRPSRATPLTLAGRVGGSGWGWPRGSGGGGGAGGALPGAVASADCRSQTRSLVAPFESGQRVASQRAPGRAPPAPPPPPRVSTPTRDADASARRGWRDRRARLV